MINRIALGSVQFGLKYGISNTFGEVNSDELKTILSLAIENGIDTIDTAYSYGKSELNLGKAGVQNFKIVSKYPALASENPRKYLLTSLERLHLKKVYGYILHDFSIYERDHKIYRELKNWKQDGLIEKTGFSLYHPGELTRIWANDENPDIIQIPFNIFDRSFEPYLTELKSRGSEIHTRSAFLQGLFFIEPEKLHPYFNKVKDKISRIREMSTKFEIPISQLCLGFVLNDINIDKVVIGVETAEQLKRNIEFSDKPLRKEIIEALQLLKETDRSIIYPQNWRL